MNDLRPLAGDVSPPPLPADRSEFRYLWPDPGAFEAPVWRLTADGRYHARSMPESKAELAEDSRWPALFPSPLCIVTTTHDGVAHVEKVVGATIANRFPYVAALSFCRQALSPRHYVRRGFMAAVEASRRITIQFLMPGPSLKSLLTAIANVPEDRPTARFLTAGLSTRSGPFNTIFNDAYLIYEGRLVERGRDFDGQFINEDAWIDIGSHRIYFFEIESIALRGDIASGRQPLHWRSLPVWRTGSIARTAATSNLERYRAEVLSHVSFIKSYRPDYVFPDHTTVAFEADEHRDGFAIKHLPPLPEDQVEVDNDRARWPCFFPSSVGLITVRDRGGRVSAMSCGSTTILARDPLTVAICVSYARINARYAPRASLDLLRNAERFGCGVPIYRPDVLGTIAYLGNVSFRDDPQKLAACGLTPIELDGIVGFAELPVQFDCRVVKAVPLGTHVMFLGQVDRIYVRSDVTAKQPLEWCPWAGHIAP